VSASPSRALRRVTDTVQNMPRSPTTQVSSWRGSRGEAHTDRNAQKMTAASIPFFSSEDLDPLPGDGPAWEPVLYRALIPCMYNMYHFACHRLAYYSSLFSSFLIAELALASIASPTSDMSTPFASR
jgi:hypothetical protein